MIQRVHSGQLQQLLALAEELWPDSGDRLYGEMKDYLTAKRKAAFLFLERECPAGFALCSLRSDYVEGARYSPTGYLEGIYVKPAFRGQKIAERLVSACEDWAKQHGCREFASDCELENAQSLAFHLHAGFSEANRVICFIKPL